MIRRSLLGIAIVCVVLVSLMCAGSCGGSSSDGGTGGGAGTLRINSDWAPSTSKTFAGYIGSAQVRIQDLNGQVLGIPACLTRSSTSVQFDNIAVKMCVVEVWAYRATNCSGPVLASARFVHSLDGATLDVSMGLESKITSIQVSGPPGGVVNGSAQFSAVAKSGSTVVLTSAQDTSFVWSVTPSTVGTIDSNGLFVAAPGLPPNAAVSATVHTVLLDIGNSGTMAIVVNGASN